MGGVRADPDLAAYVAARWSPVLRTLVLLGQPPERAEDTAVDAFARLLPEWGRLRREGDVDVELARLVLDAWVRGRSAQPAVLEVPVVAGRLVTQELEHQQALLARLADGLSRVDETTRVTVVLRYVTELDAAQVAEVLGDRERSVGNRLAEAALALDLGALDPACHDAASAIAVSPPAVAKVEARARAGRRRQWLVTGGALVALVLVAGGAYVVTRPEPAPKPQVLAVSPVENPVGTAWWLGGTLHLAHGTVKVPDVKQLVESGLGVVLADSKGHVVSISEDGEQASLGTLDPATALTSEPAIGLVAWLEAGPKARLVVYDAVTHRVLGTTPRTDDTELLGWDRGSLYYHSVGADWVLSRDQQGGVTITPMPPTQGARGALVDISAGAELRDANGQLSVVQPFFSVTIDIPGSVGQLSPDGDFVLTRSSDGTVAAYDARSGKQQEPWFPADWTPVEAVFTSESRAIWVATVPDAKLALLDCQVSRGYVNSFDPTRNPCTQRLDLPAVPLLAGVPLSDVVDRS